MQKKTGFRQTIFLSDLEFRKKILPYYGERGYNVLSFSYFWICGKETKMRESKFQHELIQDLKKRFPDCIVMKNDPNYIQGIPDLLVLHGKHWASLECKKDASSKHRPNQDYYVDKMDKMSFSRFIFPENKEEVLDDLEQSFKS